MSKKTAVVLSGGGAKGSFQVGVLKQLMSKGLEPSAFYGTSVGALNSAAMAYSGIQGTEDLWLDLRKNSDIIKFNWKNLLLCGDGIYKTTPLREILEDLIAGTPEAKAYSCKVSLTTGEIVYSEAGTPGYLEGTLASATIPIAMEPVDKVWVDGGVREQTPLKKAIKDGHDKIIVVLCNPWKSLPDPWDLPKSPFLRMASIAMRTADIITHEIFLNDIQECIAKNSIEGFKKIELEVYAPNELVIDTLEFSPYAIKKAISRGEAAKPLKF